MKARAPGLHNCILIYVKGGHHSQLIGGRYGAQAQPDYMFNRVNGDCCNPGYG